MPPNNGMVNIPRSGALAELHFPSNGFGSLTSFIFRAPKRQLTHLFNFFLSFFPFFTCLNYWFLITLICWGFFFRFAPVCFENFFFAQAIGRRTNVKEIERVFKRVFFILIIHFFNHYSLCDYKLGLKRMQFFFSYKKCETRMTVTLSLLRIKWVD